MNPSETPRQPGARTWAGEGSTPVPARDDIAVTAAESPSGRSGVPLAGATDLPAGATQPGPCPHCGHHGPRIVLCHNPACLHSIVVHDIRKDGSRGRCSATTALGRCPCLQAATNPLETTK